MEKQKRQQQQLSSLTIVILWAAIQAFGWAIIFLLADNMTSGFYQQTTRLIIIGFIGLLGGGLTGALQHTLIDRGTGVSLRHWLILSAVGSAVGFVVMELAPLWQYPLVISVMPIFVIPAIMQWFSVRQHTRAGLLWIGAHIVTTVIFIMFYEALMPQFDYDMLMFVIPAALQGIVSGFVMVWLLRQLPKQALTHEKAKVEYDSKVQVS